MHPVLATILKRLGLGVITLFVVSAIIFSSISMLPGDFGQAVLGQAATEQTVANFRKELGLDKPAYIRYFQWVGSVLKGDLGTSFSGRASSGEDRSRPVAELVAKKRFTGEEPFVEWDHLPRRARKRFANQTKCWLNTRVVEAMTPELLRDRDRDPQGDVITWMQTIVDMTR